MSLIRLVETSLCVVAIYITNEDKLHKGDQNTDQTGPPQPETIALFCWTLTIICAEDKI